MDVYVYRDASYCPYVLAEIQDGLPVHPGDLQERVRKLIAAEQPFATQSDIVLSMLGWMVRKEELKLPITIVYIDKDGSIYKMPIDVKGDFLVMPWPENGFESIIEAGFHYRFD